MFGGRLPLFILYRRWTAIIIVGQPLPCRSPTAVCSKLRKRIVPSGASKTRAVMIEVLRVPNAFGIAQIS